MPVPTTGSVSLSVVATGRGVIDGVGAATGEAVGHFDIDFTTSTMCYTITTTGLDDVTAGHIHSANHQVMTISDEIYLPIDLAAVNASAPLCGKQDTQSLADLAADPSRFVLMIHTKAFPDGAAAGSFRLDAALANSTSSSRGGLTWAHYGLWLSLPPLLVALMMIGVVARSKRHRRHSATSSSVEVGGHPRATERLHRVDFLPQESGTARTTSGLPAPCARSADGD